MRRLADEFKYTHDEISVLLGISRSHVTNLLRLLNLDARIQHWMKQGRLSEGHGKLLASLPYEKQYWFAYEAIKKEWSVRTLDEEIKLSDTKKSSRDTGELNPANPIEGRLQEQLGFPIKLVMKKNQAGYFRIPFANQEIMHEILHILGYSEEIFGRNIRK